nr:hypothetical protein [Candidatus Sigynarchaeota archaeon]
MMGMRTATTSPLKNLEQVIRGSVGIIVFAIIRFVINTVMDNAFFLDNDTVINSTIAGGIVLPVVWIIVTSIGRGFIQKDRRVALLFFIGTMGLAIASLLVVIFGMCYFMPYSRTIFDTFVKDLVVFLDGMD